MKKLILLNIIIFILGAPVTNAQKERIEYLPNFDKRTLHFGYYVGINNNSYKISYFDQSGFDASSPVNPTPPTDMFVSVKEAIGFNLGFVIDYRLHNNINLRFEPGLMSTGTKELTFINHNAEATSNGTSIYPGTRDNTRKVSGTYMHLPLLLKFSTNRLNNMRPYIIGGVSYDYNFSSNEKNGEDNFEGEFRMKSSNFMYEVGVGVDFYFYFFKFTPSIRGIFAINNELVRDRQILNLDPEQAPYSSPWTGPIDYFGTRGIFLNLTFE
ncbi:MAG: PorT family protein [Flavobacteriaceae bacterium]|nr:PorT family protein [Flavobacteriaceae bacterium]